MSGRNKKRVVAAGVVLATMGTAAVAYAQWSSTATGSGRARAVTTVEATIDPVSGAPDLYPGFTEGDVFFTIDNPNDFGITYTAMTATTVTSSDETNCPAENVTIAPATGLTLVSPSGTSGTLSIADVVTMSPAAPDGCQGVDFDIALTLTGEQSA